MNRAKEIRKLIEAVEGLNELGHGHGTTDSGPPEDHSPEELSRLSDVYRLTYEFFGKEQAQKVFASFPDSMKLEYNYAKWKYVPEQK